MAQEHSKACCTIPPVVAKDYKEKGTWTTIAGLKTCKLNSSFPLLAKNGLEYLQFRNLTRSQQT